MRNLQELALEFVVAYRDLHQCRPSTGEELKNSSIVQELIREDLITVGSDSDRTSDTWRITLGSIYPQYLGCFVSFKSLEFVEEVRRIFDSTGIMKGAGITSLGW